MVVKNNFTIEKFDLTKKEGAFQEIFIDDEYIIIDKEELIQFALDETITGTYESLLLNTLRHKKDNIGLENDTDLYKFVSIYLDDIIKELVKTLIKLYDDLDY